MSNAPENIWVGSDICHDSFGPEPDIWKDEASSYETDIKYTRTDIADARIAELQDARDLGIIQGDIVAHLTVVALTARTAELEAALNGMVDHYVALVECGDCGHWNAESEMPVKYARSVLKGKT
jgi:hypothetical protein